MKSRHRSSSNLFRNMHISLALIILCFALFALAMTFYGLYLAFSASILLGVACLILEPSPAVFGIVMLFWDKNLPQMIIQWLEK